jgi:hypothetical protein
LLSKSSHSTKSRSPTHRSDDSKSLSKSSHFNIAAFGWSRQTENAQAKEDPQESVATPSNVQPQSQQAAHTQPRRGSLIAAHGWSQPSDLHHCSHYHLTKTCCSSISLHNRAAWFVYFKTGKNNDNLNKFYNDLFF